MPKPACVKCCVEYVPIAVGVKAIETHLPSREPYKIWGADLWACPKCRSQILIGYGKNPIAEHYQDDFAQKLRDALLGKHVFIHEK